jgi:rubrerythrin
LTLASSSYPTYTVGNEEDSMDLFDIAIKLEQEGAQLYTELAQRAPTEGFTTIFKMLANDEKKHESYFRALQGRSALVTVSSSVFEQAKQVFRDFNPDNFFVIDGQIPAYEEALLVEKKSIDFYTEQLPSLEFEAEKKALKLIIAEEKRHYAILEEIIKLVTRPHRWVESAEFGVREEY